MTSISDICSNALKLFRWTKFPFQHSTWPVKNIWMLLMLNMKWIALKFTDWKFQQLVQYLSEFQASSRLQLQATTPYKRRVRISPCHIQCVVERVSHAWSASLSVDTRIELRPGCYAYRPLYYQPKKTKSTGYFIWLWAGWSGFGSSIPIGG
jgi:hypothetical protein